MTGEEGRADLRVPGHLEPLLEEVLRGQTRTEAAGHALGLSEYELGILLRALIRQRAREGGEFTD
ncbi:MAG: hypothetical protein ACK47B_02800 [Armatimonadota bacterium]